MKKRAEERVALREATAEFEKKWEADRVDKVEAGKEQMAMQVRKEEGRQADLLTYEPGNIVVLLADRLHVSMAEEKRVTFKNDYDELCFGG